MSRWGLLQECKVGSIFEKSIGVIQKKLLVTFKVKKAPHAENGKAAPRPTTGNAANTPKCCLPRLGKALSGGAAGRLREKNKVAKVRPWASFSFLDNVDVYTDIPGNAQANHQNKHSVQPGFGARGHFSEIQWFSYRLGKTIGKWKLKKKKQKQSRL